MEQSKILPEEQIHASAVQFLIDGHEEDAANVLLSCTLQVWDSNDTWYQGKEVLSGLHVNLVGPRPAYEIICDSEHRITKAIENAIGAVLPVGFYTRHFTASAKLIDIDPDWKSDLLEIAKGRGVHNQGANATKTWNNLRFRSVTEIRIAEALDKAGVLFLPNCLARVNTSEGRKTKEADFLVCYNGKWGILEVDGEPYHPSTRTVEDHKRDRLFRTHGVRVVEHYDANECYSDPSGVVRNFLNILKDDRM